jgi:P27 family predicted phage terminase small subunit
MPPVAKKPGLPRVPTPILKARGSRLANRNDAEPTPPPGRPICPSWLKGEGRRAFRVLAPVLFDMGVFTKIDINAFSRYCRLWDRWKKADTFIAEHGDMYPVRQQMMKRKEDGTVYYEMEVIGFKMYPEVKVADMISKQLLHLEQEFGLTPSARSSLRSPEHHGEKTPEEKQKADLIKFRKDA